MAYRGQRCLLVLQVMLAFRSHKGLKTPFFPFERKYSHFKKSNFFCSTSCLLLVIFYQTWDIFKSSTLQSVSC